jgi:flagellar motor switch protein FliM
MKLFNITAQIYELDDSSKQTILMNELIESLYKESALDLFKLNLIEKNSVLVKILSAEEISQVEA